MITGLFRSATRVSRQLKTSLKGGAAIVTQMLEYAVALAEDPQWNNHYVNWTFWGIVHELDAVGIAKTHQRDRAPGLVDSLKNSTIWLKTWSQVIADARSCEA